MSYADLKPVRFEENYHYYNVASQLEAQYYHPETAQHSAPTNFSSLMPQQEEVSLSAYFTPYPESNPLQYNRTTQLQQSNNQPATPERPDSNLSDVSNNLRNHWMPMTWIERSADDPGVFNFVCLWGSCVEVMATKDRFIDHMYAHIDQLSAEKIQNPQGLSECSCRVRGCEKILSDLENLQRHMTMHIFQADCQQKGSEALIEREEYESIECCGFEPLLNVHYDGEVLVCQWVECGAPFTSLTELFEHAALHIDNMDESDRVLQVFDNGEKQDVYPCKWGNCSVVAQHKSSLKRHIRHHSGEKVLACPFCAKFFSRKDKLYDHVIRRTLCMNDFEDPYVCKLCQKTFGTEKALCMHVTRHLVSESCPLCGLSVASRSNLHRHLMAKHSSRTREHKCPSCAKAYYSESELSRHVLIHTENSYNCKMCDEKFRWKKQLLKHMKSHDENFNPSPYICHLCARTYTTGFALGRHLTKQHNCAVPIGFSRFTYKKCADGLMRLQTKKIFRSDE
ncbi:unnamed protein product [Caenorhabditis bovis]|uniref:C2H2-type domain-containing protein n=1 Tax=Caenorhabditis bovis TaxID=2654633 RepID=A0A8S1FDE8_9PELO|nr:unnamed protein product [Caenorhabditis bovis]